MKMKAIAITMMILFLLSMSFLTVTKALAGTEIAYDDGSKEDQWTIGWVYKVGVMFSKSNLPYSENLLTTVRIYIVSVSDGGQELSMYFFDSSFNEIHASIVTPALQVGWNDIDVSSYNIVLNNDFLIALQWYRPDGGGTTAYLGYDTDNPGNNPHSYEYNPYKWPAPGWHSPPDPTGTSGEYGIWMIRAVVEPAPGGVIPEVPVGTIVASAAMVIALVGYVAMPKLKRNRDYVIP